MGGVGEGGRGIPGLAFGSSIVFFSFLALFVVVALMRDDTDSRRLKKIESRGLPTISVCVCVCVSVDGFFFLN